VSRKCELFHFRYVFLQIASEVEADTIAKERARERSGIGKTKVPLSSTFEWKADSLSFRVYVCSSHLLVRPGILCPFDGLSSWFSLSSDFTELRLLLVSFSCIHGCY
jgi:hypothetical protein